MLIFRGVPCLYLLYHLQRFRRHQPTLCFFWCPNSATKVGRFVTVRGQHKPISMKRRFSKRRRFLNRHKRIISYHFCFFESKWICSKVLQTTESPTHQKRPTTGYVRRMPARPIHHKPTGPTFGVKVSPTATWHVTYNSYCTYMTLLCGDGSVWL